MNYRLLAKYLGLIAAAIGITMIPAAGIGLLYGEYRVAMAMLGGGGVSVGVALALRLMGIRAEDTMRQRESLALVGFTWVLAAVLGAFPYMFAGTFTSPVDAFFESCSGFTTTGATVLANVEAAPRGILFWRAMTQWLGGIGIAVLFVAVLPYLGAGGKQLFKLEVPGPESQAFRPRIRDTAKFLFRFYLGITAGCFVLLWIAGMSAFDAICHTFTTVSTAGFSTRQESIGAFDNPIIEWIIVVFAIVAAINFGLYFAMLRGHRKAIWKNAEVRVFLGVLAIAIALMTFNLMGVQGEPGPVLDLAIEEGIEGRRYDHIDEVSYPFGEAFRRATFQGVSIMTTTGYVTDDFDMWPHFSRTTLLILMFVGGCAGSTAGGFKVVRIIIMLKMAYWRLERSFRPKTVRIVRVGEDVVDEEIQRHISGFFVLFLCWFLLGTLLLSLFGLPLDTALSAVLACLNNIGPGIGLVGAHLDYHLLPDVVKVYLSFCMVLGRLELFTLSVMLLPSFWRSRWTH